MAEDQGWEWREGAEKRGEEGTGEGVLLMKLTGWLYEELAFNFFMHVPITNSLQNSK